MRYGQLVPELVVETPEGLTLRYELAGAGSRCAAALFDVVLWGTSTALAIVVSVAFLGGAGGLFVWIASGVLVSLALYQIAFGVLWDGRTPGKWLLGIRVVDQEGFPASGAQHLLRGLFWPFEVLVVVPVPLAVLFVATTPQRQRLGDMVAGTVVVRDVERRVAGEPFRRASWSELPRRRLGLVPAQAARFDGEDLDFLRELLGRTGLDRSARERLLRQSARHYARELGLEVAPKLGLQDAHEILRELYLFLREMRLGRPRDSTPPTADAAVRGSARARGATPP